MERKKVSEHFYADEFDCPCCGLNITSPEIISKVQQMRSGYGQPITITSGTRCLKRNKEVKGSPTSDHLTGAAIDIACYNAIDRRALVDLALMANVPTIGIKRDCLHLSIGMPARIFTYD